MQAHTHRFVPVQVIGALQQLQIRVDPTTKQDVQQAATDCTLGCLHC